VIALAVRWYLRFALSYRDVEKLLAERGVEVDRHGLPLGATVHAAARRGRPALPARGWRPLAGRRNLREGRDAKAARRFFERAIGATKPPVEVVTDKAPVSPLVLQEPLPVAWHRTDRYAANHIEADHGRLKSRLGPMRGLKQDRSARVVIAEHAFVQNLRRGHYELAVDGPVNRRVPVPFNEPALAIQRQTRSRLQHAAN
jgi:transposase-like protein